MRNRGQFFGLYLVFITLFMCGVVVGLFYIQQKNVDSALVSPKAILELEDNLNLFEIREILLINESLDSLDSGLDFCSDEFSVKFMDIFIEGVLRDEDMMKFIIIDSSFEGRKAEKLGDGSFAREVLYSNELGKCNKAKDRRVFTRSSINKEFKLSGSDRNKINFPVDFSFSFGKEHIINSEGVVS